MNVLGVAGAVQNQNVTVQQLQQFAGRAAAATMQGVLEDGLESQSETDDLATESATEALETNGEDPNNGIEEDPEDGIGDDPGDGTGEDPGDGIGDEPNGDNGANGTNGDNGVDGDGEY
jgi:hypothetical protein